MFAPFASYMPTSNTRQVKAGPHLMFLQLQRTQEERPDLFHRVLTLFAQEHGLLGMFEEDYLHRPILPMGKNLIAPEAGVTGQGRLERFDPATEGKGLLRKALIINGRMSPYDDDLSLSGVALPSEMKFVKRDPHLNSQGWPVEQPRQLVPWEVIKEEYGAVLILNPHTFTGVSVLCTREPVLRWRIHLSVFPSGDTPTEELLGGAYNSLNSYLQDVSPRVVLDEDGNLERDWHCRSLLQAMYAMLFLDLTGGNTIKRCESRGCLNYYRLGAQGKSRYCSERCANRASTRRRRGHEP